MMYKTESQRTAEVARLEDYVHAFMQRKALVFALFVLGVVLAYFYTLATAASYEATAQVRLRPTPVGSTNGNPVAPKLEEENRVLSSDSVVAEVRQTYPATNVDQLDVKFTPDSNILLIGYMAPSPDEASAIANAFADVYSSQRTREAEQFYLNRVAANQSLLTEIEGSIQALREQRRQLVTQRTALLEQPPTATRTAQIDDNSRDIDLIDGQIGTLTADLTATRSDIRLDETSLVTLTSIPPAFVLSRASIPSGPAGIPSAFILVGGAVVGLAIGLVGAFLLERLDTTARDEEAVALALNSMVMGTLPTLGVGHSRGSNSLIMLSSGGSARVAAAREAFRRLRSSLLFLKSSSGVSSVIVTSSAPGEGKSMIASNLSIALAQSGSRVVLVSADMRRPTLEGLLGMESDRAGLADYLAQTAELNAEKVPGIDNLWLIRSGRPPSNPGELLNSGRFEQMIKELEREDVDYIVIDTPPVLSTADALSAARYVDGLIVVVDAERTDTSDLLQVRSHLERSGSQLLGAVINRHKLERRSILRRDRYAYYRAEAKRVKEQ